jgi:EpsI family protein
MKSRHAAVALCALFVAALPVSIRWGDPLDRLVGTVRLARPLSVAVPAEFAGWKGTDVPLTEKEQKTILVDDAVRRAYRGPDGELVTLFVSYHGNKERGLQRYYHNPTVCYTAAGWRLDSSRFETVTLTDMAKTLPTCRYVFVRDDGARQLVLTLVRVDEEYLDESPRNKPFWMLVDRLTPRLDDGPGTFVQVQVIVPVRGRDEAEASLVATRFLEVFGRTVVTAVEVRAGT